MIQNLIAEEEQVMIGLIKANIIVFDKKEKYNDYSLNTKYK